MFFLLSKIFYFILLPLTWIIIILLAGIISKKERRKKIFLWIAFSLLMLFTQPFITNEVMRLWEIGPIPIKDLHNYDLAIILTGITKDSPPRDRVNFTHGADRVLHPIQLFKMGKIRKILITGGSGLIVNNQNDIESENIRKTLLLSGIPDSAIELETKARNTHENALFTSKILENKKTEEKFLLVTSSYHMRRALACFKKEGLKVTPFPVEFYSKERSLTPDIILPSLDSLLVWHALFKEWFGMITYKISGYI